MAKVLKIAGRFFGGTLEWSLILIIAVAFLIRSSPVQTFLAQKTAAYLSDELNAKVKVDKVDIYFFDRVAIGGILIEDQQGDTLVAAARLLVNLDRIDLKTKSYTLAEAELRNGYVHIQRNKDSVFNHSFLKDYFVREKKKKSNMHLDLRYAKVSGMHFRYDDALRAPKEEGMDYFHLDARDIAGNFIDLEIDKDTIYGRIEGLTAKEKCGFDLQCLTTSVKVSPKGVYLSDLEIFTKDSWVRSEQFNMISKTYTSFRYFVDSVKFDGRIAQSDVNLAEVAYFAPVLTGMNDHIRLETVIKNKVTKLRLPDFHLSYRENTRIDADLRLADYRNLENGFYDERVNAFHVDFSELKQLRLPSTSASPYIQLSPEIERLKFVEGDDVAITGFTSDFVFAANTFRTALGWAQLNEGINFKQADDGDHYRFQSSATQQYDFTVHNFMLGSYLNNSDVGVIDGSFKIAGSVYSSSDIRFSNITGDINTFEYATYPYSDITIEHGSFQKNRFDGYVTVNDEFLKLTYDGFLDFNGENNMQFKVFITESNLKELNLSEEQSQLLSNMKVAISGKNVNSYQGTIEFDRFIYTVEDETFDMDDFKLTITRGKDEDQFTINGSALEANITGKINLADVVDNFNYQFSKIFPAIYGERAYSYKQPKEDRFAYSATFYNPNNFIHLFFPDLHIARNTTINGSYNGAESRFALNVYGDSLRYKTMKFTNLSLEQTMNNDQVLADYHIDQFRYTDSLVFNDVYFNTNGGNNHLAHRLTWAENTKVTSEISWDSEVRDADHFGFVLNPSHFYLQHHQWDISHASSISFQADTIRVDTFELTRNKQHITVNGQVSNNERDKLRFDIEALELEELSPFITTNYPMSGTINLEGMISDPFGNFGYEGDGTLTEFIVNNQKVGDLSIASTWDKFKKAIKTEGNLFYADEKTFDFDGHYYLLEKENNLDFNLNFDLTNLQFTNAFMDPDVVSEIRGFLDGSLKLTGTPELPLLDGSVALRGGSAFIDLLGVHFGVDGMIQVDEYGFYINGIPVFDEDGNSGLLVGSVFHDNFSNFNFDLQFDLEPQLYASNTSIFGPEISQRFLVMDLPYSHDAIYYGKGYVTGMANIFGYTDNLEITVDFKTQKGTELNIPMFGVGEIEEEDFITFVNDKSDSTEIVVAPPFDLTGVYLDLNFEATRDATVKIIFNEDIGDIITANGSGDISIRLNNQNDITMEGTYEVAEGIYNFAMLPVANSPITVKQPFIIEPGGTVSWTGDPYDARIDMKTYYQLSANLSEISGGSELGSSGGAHQRVLSYLILTGTMEEPVIQFDIQAPQADDVGETLINRIKSDPDELNRQFFSLMISRQFQPLAGSTTASGSGAVDLITNQINQALARVSNDYRLKLDIDNDVVSGDNTFEFGVSKGFLDDRLILSGSFGVESYGEEEVDDNGNVHTGQLIGDLNLEYLLNESGTFRVNIFNESTDNTVIQERGEGDFTQGAGLSYKEDFESFDDFKVVQYVFDLFRKKENKRYPNKGNRQQRPIPEGEIVLPEDED
jgi:hypothetical protein